MLLLAVNKSFKNVSNRAGGPCDGRLNASVCFKRRLNPSFPAFTCVKESKISFSVCKLAP